MERRGRFYGLKIRGGERIRPSNCSKILGVCFDSNITFRSHLKFGENALIPKLKKRMGALKFLRKLISAKQSKKLAEGLKMCRILHGIHVWENMLPKVTVEKV